MDTRDIVASNLTIAYCAAHPDITSEEKIIEAYRRFGKHDFCGKAVGRALHKSALGHNILAPSEPEARLTPL